MINLYRVSVKVIQAETFFDTTGELPKVQIATNLTIEKTKKVDDQNAVVYFQFTVNYSPSIASIVLKGECEVNGDKKYIEKLTKTKKPENQILQRIANSIFIDSICCCKLLGIPPPLPLPIIR